jgi:hypothetical protein
MLRPSSSHHRLISIKYISSGCPSHLRRFLWFALLFHYMPIMKTEHDEEAEAFLDEPLDSEDVSTIATKKRSLWARSRSYIRLFIEIGMAATIVFLLFFRAPPSRTLRRSPVPDCTFTNNRAQDVILTYLLSPTENLHLPQ